MSGATSRRSRRITPTSRSCDVMNDIFTGYPCTAVCANPSDVMSSGKHYATFTPTGSHRLFYFWIGIVRPKSTSILRTASPAGRRLDDGEVAFWNEHQFEQFRDAVTVKDDDARAKATSNVDYCAYYTLEGDCKCADFRSTPGRLEGRPCKAVRNGGTLMDHNMDAEFGLLLDLDEGTLVVYKNGKRLGVLKDGLRGEYVWTASIMAHHKGTGEEQNVRIQRAPVPTS
ncbi:hypothetical protein ACHAXT_001280 [Thalassiosira profunda]